MLIKVTQSQIALALCVINPALFLQNCRNLPSRSIIPMIQTMLSRAAPAEAEKQHCVVQQTYDILTQEYMRWMNEGMDVLLSEFSYFLPSISPCRYLQQHKTLSGHNSKVTDIAFSPDSYKIFSVCTDGFGIIWDLLSGLKLQAIPLDFPWAMACAYSPSGRIVALGGLENKCSIYTVNVDQNLYPAARTNNIPLKYKTSKSFGAQHKALIHSMEFLSNNELITASGDSVIRLWDVEKLRKVCEFVAHSLDVLSVLKVTGDTATPRNFFSSSCDGTVRYWDSRDPNPVQTLQTELGNINVVALHPDGNCVVIGDELGECRMYDLRSVCMLESYDILEQFQYKNNTSYGPMPSSEYDLRTLPPTPRSPGSSLTEDKYSVGGVTSIDISKSGRVMYACYSQYGCIAWDLFQRKIIEKIGNGRFAHRDRISLVKVSGDGQALATASWDSTVKIWTI